MKGARPAWIVFGAAAAAVALLLARGERNGAAASSALDAERQRHVELVRLRDEGLRLRNDQPTAEEKARLEQGSAEAARLRARLGALEQEAAGLPSAIGAGPKVPAKDWIYAGRASPDSTIESVLWAASRGDVDRLSGLLAFAPDVRARVETLFSQLPAESQQDYGSPEKVVATLLAGSFPKDASAMTIQGGTILEREASVSVAVEHSDGATKNNMVKFQRTTDGWQVLVPSSVMASCEKLLLGDGHPPESATP
jgi:hypothetical protein